MRSKEFNQPEYWKSRISGNIDLGIVGYRSLGKGYNEYIYRRRLDVLNEVLEKSIKPIADLKILEIGCGNGFYIEQWRSLGVTQLTGVDISPGSVALMKDLYPEYTFYVVDAAKKKAFDFLDTTYDLITIFDVIYHVVNDVDAAQLLINAASVLHCKGCMLVTDVIGKKNYGFVQHVRYRSFDFYNTSLNCTQHNVLNHKMIFNMLHPPVVRNKILDYIISGAYYIVGSVMRINDNIGRIIGNIMYRLDKLLAKAGLLLPNQSLIFIGSIKNGNILNE